MIVLGSGAGASVVEGDLSHGLSVALVDKGPFRGTCLNIGCIPQKSLFLRQLIQYRIQHLPCCRKQQGRKTSSGYIDLLTVLPEAVNIAEAERMDYPGFLQHGADSDGMISIRGTLVGAPG